MSEKEKIQVEIEVKSKTLSVSHAACPNGHLLADETKLIHGKPALKVKAESAGQSGILFIDPVYGSHDNIEVGIEIADGGLVKFFCPTCGVDLTDPDETCRVCASPMFLFHLPHGGIVEGCLKKGCMFHKMKIVDEEHQIQRMFDNPTLESYL